MNVFCFHATANTSIYKLYRNTKRAMKKSGREGRLFIVRNAFNLLDCSS